MWARSVSAVSLLLLALANPVEKEDSPSQNNRARNWSGSMTPLFFRDYAKPQAGLRRNHYEIDESVGILRKIGCCFR